MGATSGTEPIVNYQEGQDITKKDNKINNVTPQTGNTIMVYNEITKEVYIDKPERAKPNGSSNHNTDESNIFLAKLKQEIEIKHTEQEASKAEIMKGVVENEEIIQELEVKSCEKGKTESKVEIIKVKQLVEKTTTQKEYQNIGEIIEDKVPVEMANIQTKTKQQDNDIVAKKTSNYQQQKEATGNGQRNEIGEKLKYSDSEQQGKDDKTYNFRSTSTRAKIETKKRGKEDNINSELAQEENSDISNRDVCPLCNRPVKTGVECGICSRWFHYKCEGTTEERVLKEYPHETHYICKKDKEQKELEVATRDRRKQLQEEEAEEELKEQK